MDGSSWSLMRPASVQCSLLGPIVGGEMPCELRICSTWALRDQTLNTPSLMVRQRLKGTPEHILELSIQKEMLPQEGSALWAPATSVSRIPFPVSEKSYPSLTAFCLFPCLLSSHPGDPVVDIWELYSVLNFAIFSLNLCHCASV